jgi:YVTN family beta-propeller protein
MWVTIFVPLHETMEKPMKLFVTMLLITTSAFAHSGNHVYVVNKSANSMSIVDADSLVVEHTIGVGDNPHEMAVAPNGSKAYVGNAGGNSISVVDLRTFREMKTITTPEFSFPHGIAFTPDSSIAVVTSERTQKVVIIDALSDEVIGSIDMDQGGTHMTAVDHDGRWAYFTNRESNTVSFMDLENYEVVANVPIGQGGEGFALSPDGSEIWVANRGADTVSVIDVASRRVVETFGLDGRPNRVAFTADGAHVLLPLSSGELHVFEAETRERVRSVPIGSAPAGITASTDGERVYVAMGGGDQIYVIDTNTWTVTDRVTVGQGPDGIVYR